MALNTAPAAAAAPAPAAPAPQQPSAPPSPQTSVDEDSQIIEDLRREHFAKEKGKTKDETPDVAEADEAGADDESEDEEGIEEPADDSEDADEPSEPAKSKGGKPAKVATPKYKNVKTALVAIQKAIESGDAKKIAAAIGKPASFVKVNDAKWMAFRAQQSKLRERVREVSKRETDFNSALAQAQRDYAPVIEARQAYRDGKLDRFVELIEQLTGDTYDEATRKVVKGETALSPEVKALRKQLQEQAAELAKLKKGEREEPPEQQREAQAQRVVKAVRDELGHHPVTKLKGYERMVIEAVRESWDPDLEEYTLSFEDAADQIVEERRQEARHFTRGRQLPPPRERSPEPPPRGRAADPHVAKGDPWLERDLSEDELVDSIIRDARTGRIRPQ